MHAASVFGARLAVCIALLQFRIAATATAAEPASQSAIVSLLQASDLKGRLALTQAEQRFEVAKGISTDDRTVHYAYGVVLSRALKFSEAQAQFALAADSPQGAYPAALRGSLYLQLQLRRWLLATDTSLAFCGALVNEPTAWPQENKRFADAFWLGQAVAAGQLLVSTGDDVRRWLEVDRQIREQLPAALRKSYSAGFEATLDVRTELAEETAEERAAAQIKQADEQELERRKVLEEQRQNESTRVTLKEVVKGNKQLFEKQLAEYAKQLGLLENQWNQFDERRQLVERSIILVSQEMTLLQQQYDNILNQDRNPKSPSTATRFRLQAIDQQLLARQLQSLQYQAERDRTIRAQGAVHQQATGVLAQRQAAAADYEHQTGEVLKRDDQLEKWNSRLLKKAVELETPPEGNTAEVKLKERKLQTIAAYLSIDWEAERQRLLAELQSK